MARERFVDLLSALVYPLASWRELRRYPIDGRSLAHLAGREALPRGTHRDWWVRALSAEGWQVESRQLLASVALKEIRPDVLLLALASDVSQREVDALAAACSVAGIKQPIIWGRSTLERILELERPDLRFAFFGVGSSRRIRMKARGLQRRVAIKQQLQQHLLLPQHEQPSKTVQPFEKMRFAKVILRSIDDNTYPERTHSLGTAPGWTEVGTYDFYHDGLEVVVGTVDVIVDAQGVWSPVAARERFDATRFQRIRAFEVGRIPFGNIIVCDPAGDEYYRQPHLFCSYANVGQPYDEFRYYSVTDPFVVPLLPEKLLGCNRRNSADDSHDEENVGRTA